MKTAFNFLKTTIFGGICFLLPLVVTLVLLREALRFVAKIATPLAKIFPLESVVGIRTEYLLATLTLIAFSFFVGLLAKAGLGSRFNRWLEHTVLRRVPGYSLLKGLARDLEGREGAANFPTALAHFGDNVWQLCFIVERHANGYITVFAPGAPSPTSGNVCFLPSSQVKEIDIPMSAVMKCHVQIGAGSRELLEGKAPFSPGKSAAEGTNHG